MASAAVPAQLTLCVHDLVAGYGASTVLHGVSLKVAAGASVALLGPNGAGKSTLLKTLSGILRSRQGEITFLGERIERAAPHRVVKAGLIHVPEGRQVFPELSVEENLLLGGFSRRPNKDLHQQVLHLFPRLADRRRQQAQTLSGGEQQMLAIGRGLMAEPRLLVIDEPTLGLAPVLIDELAEHLQAVRNQLGTPLLLVEQNAYLTSLVCDETYVLANGRIVRHATTTLSAQELMDSYLGSSPAGGPHQEEGERSCT